MKERMNEVYEGNTFLDKCGIQPDNNQLCIRCRTALIIDT